MENARKNISFIYDGPTNPTYSISFQYSETLKDQTRDNNCFRKYGNIKGGGLPKGLSQNKKDVLPMGLPCKIFTYKNTNNKLMFTSEKCSEILVKPLISFLEFFWCVQVEKIPNTQVSSPKPFLVA